MAPFLRDQFTAIDPFYGDPVDHHLPLNLKRSGFHYVMRNVLKQGRDGQPPRPNLLREMDEVESESEAYDSEFESESDSDDSQTMDADDLPDFEYVGPYDGPHVGRNDDRRAEMMVMQRLRAATTRVRAMRPIASSRTEEGGDESEDNEELWVRRGYRRRPGGVGGDFGVLHQQTARSLRGQGPIGHVNGNSRKRTRSQMEEASADEPEPSTGLYARHPWRYRTDPHERPATWSCRREREIYEMEAEGESSLFRPRPVPWFVSSGNPIEGSGFGGFGVPPAMRPRTEDDYRSRERRRPDSRVAREAEDEALLFELLEARWARIARGAAATTGYTDGRMPSWELRYWCERREAGEWPWGF